VLSAAFIPSLLVGAVLVIVGSFFDRQRLPVVVGYFGKVAHYRCLSPNTSSGHALLAHKWHFSFAAEFYWQCPRLDFRIYLPHIPLGSYGGRKCDHPGSHTAYCFF
jgi:hypothetical protein